MQEYVGGYEDWVRQAGVPRFVGFVGFVRFFRFQVRVLQVLQVRRVRQAARLSYNEQRELTELPARIAVLEEEQAALHARVQAPEFYKEAPDAIAATLARVEQVGRRAAGRLRALGRAGLAHAETGRSGRVTYPLS